MQTAELVEPYFLLSAVEQSELSELPKPDSLAQLLGCGHSGNRA